MQLLTPTSFLNEFYYVDRFDDILALCGAMKCNKFYVDASRHKIFGFYDENYSVVETDLPFPVNHSFFFGRTAISTPAYRESIGRTKTYFFVKEYPYCFFPENRRADLMNNNLVFDFRYNAFVDRMTGRVLDDILVTIPYDEWFRMDKYLEFLQLYIDRHMTLEFPIVFDNMDQNEIIQKVNSSKVSQGTELLTLRTAEDVFSFYIFKSLLGPLTKSDKLSIIIQKDVLEPNKFAATFSVFKKKPKLGIPELLEMRVNTHVMMLNLAK